MALGDAVLLDIEDDGPATITLNQPDRRNAFSAEIHDEFVAAFEEIEGSDARCVVIEGAGGAFSAGETSSGWSTPSRKTSLPTIVHAASSSERKR